MSDAPAKPPFVSFWFSVLVVLGCFLIFAFVLWVAYLPSRAKVQDPVAGLTEEQRKELNLLRPDERLQRLADMRANEQQVANGYAWIDREKGIVQLPISRAVELTVKDLGTRQ